MTASIIHLNAGNDANGNPRRIYVGIGEDGRLLGAWNEGYDGSRAVPEQYRDAAKFCPSFATTPKQYRELVKFSRRVTS